MKTKATILHRDRKNPKSREAYEKLRREQNALRSPQTFDPETKTWRRDE